jgi:hypothetical protein
MAKEEQEAKAEEPHYEEVSEYRIGEGPPRHFWLSASF